MSQPGAAWNYSLSTDVLGRVVEVASNQAFDVFLRERIFKPLGMTTPISWWQTPSGRAWRRSTRRHGGRHPPDEGSESFGNTHMSPIAYYKAGKMLLGRRGPDVDDSRLLTVRADAVGRRRRRRRSPAQPEASSSCRPATPAT